MACYQCYLKHRQYFECKIKNTLKCAFQYEKQNFVTCIKKNQSVVTLDSLTMTSNIKLSLWTKPLNSVRLFLPSLVLVPSIFAASLVAVSGINNLLRSFNS